MLSKKWFRSDETDCLVEASAQARVRVEARRPVALDLDEPRHGGDGGGAQARRDSEQAGKEDLSGAVRPRNRRVTGAKRIGAPVNQSSEASLR